MENLTGGTPPVRYLLCVVPCKLYFTENDKYDFVDEKECRIFLEMLRNQYGRYETENFSSIVPRKIDEQCVISKQII